MTFEQYQREWNALKAGVLDCSVPTYFAIECLIAMKYTAKEAETEIENWLFEAAINRNDRNSYHSVISTEKIVDNRNVPS